MRIMTVLSAGCLLAGLIALTNAVRAQEQPAYVPRPNSVPVYAGATYYPYGHPWFPCHAYRHTVRFSYVPVVPKALFRCADALLRLSFLRPSVLCLSAAAARLSRLCWILGMRSERLPDDGSAADSDAIRAAGDPSIADIRSGTVADSAGAGCAAERAASIAADAVVPK